MNFMAPAFGWFQNSSLMPTPHRRCSTRRRWWRLLVLVIASCWRVMISPPWMPRTGATPLLHDVPGTLDEVFRLGGEHVLEAGVLACLAGCESVSGAGPGAAHLRRGDALVCGQDICHSSSLERYGSGYPLILRESSVVRLPLSGVGAGVVFALQVPDHHLLSTLRDLSLCRYARRACRFPNRVERQAAESGRGRVWLIGDGVDDALRLSELGVLRLDLLQERGDRLGDGGLDGRRRVEGRRPWRPPAGRIPRGGLR